MREDEPAQVSRITAFELYLRTGRRLPAMLEVKFNPWHDPANGRFTVAQGGTRGERRPDGSWVGGGFTGGGGGSGGGAGASGTWDGPAVIPDRSTARSPVRSPAAGAIGAKPAARQPVDRVVIRNGYSFRIDPNGRTREVSGTITLGRAEPRSRGAQAAAGGAERRQTDEGGHYIAYRFNGPRDAFNHFAQDRNFNRSGYAKLENIWNRAVRLGETVKVDIVPTYAAGSKRPATINLFYSINGKEDWRQFPNGPGAR